MIQLTDSIRFVKGIGQKKAELFQKLNVFSLFDALLFYPRDYEDRTELKVISALQEGDKTCICAVAATPPSVTHVKKGMDLTKFKVFDSTGSLQIAYFNNKYAALSIKQGEEYLFYGKIQGSGSKRFMLSPEFELSSRKGTVTSCILPVYPLTAGITRKDVVRITDTALCALPNDFEDYIPERFISHYGLERLREALFMIHKPETLSDALKARKRLIFEEFFLLSCGLGRLKARREKVSGISFSNLDLTDFYDALPFELTNGQKSAIADCIQDLKAGKALNRLVQGDVGSGKTVVAAALCALAVQNGCQTAFMVPTEILAAQHLDSLRAMFDKLGITAVLLTGSMSAKAKREALFMLETGSAQVAVGTHALIQEAVKFKKLGAVIVDEQHRFGVNQRADLASKGENPHILVMSATPIPRTLALIVYGDLDISAICDMPPGRTPVETYAVGEDMRERIYKFMEKQCASGGQVYVVCPLVEDGESGKKSAESYAEKLKISVFPNRRIGLIHGRLPQTQKDDIMAKFAGGEIDILVSTTVIEVGVNVLNATLMVVENADNFGLSQLHQLRGRVGRGNRQSYCVLFGADKGENARNRLKILCKTGNGFEISQSDLEIRGPGDFFGSRQHGLPQLKLADLSSDLKLLQDAQSAAAEILKESFDLSAYPKLKKQVEKMFQKPQGDIFN